MGREQPETRGRRIEDSSGSGFGVSVPDKPLCQTAGCFNCPTTRLGACADTLDKVCVFTIATYLSIVVHQSLFRSYLSFQLNIIYFSLSLVCSLLPPSSDTKPIAWSCSHCSEALDAASKLSVKAVLEPYDHLVSLARGLCNPWSLPRLNCRPTGMVFS